MRRGRDLADFATEHLLPVVSVGALTRHWWANTQLVEPGATAAMPTRYGRFRAVAYRNTLDGCEHLALVLGDVAAAGTSPRGALVRVHSECLTGDIVGSLRCDCGEQLTASLAAIAREGCGAVIYLRGHEGRGIGLGSKLRAYELQDQGLDTVDANIVQGLPVDGRTYGVAAQILASLGVGKLRLITNNPAKLDQLGGYGLDIVERVAVATTPNPDNIRYLRSKRDRLNHRLESVLGL
jgi:3,4-dihydroxy 2-butanone 4-phosphate synthase/GTP cyclohydrolase II